MLFIVSMRAWFYSSAVEISGQGMIVMSGLLGLGKRRQVSLEAVDLISVQWVGTIGAMNYCRLIAKCKDGTSLRLANSLAGLAGANAIKACIEERIAAHGRGS